MSQLQKKIERIQRPEGPGLGFAHIARAKPRAIVLGVVATSSAEATAALAAGADLVLVRADVAAAARIARDSAGEGACIGVLVESLDAASAATLRDAGVDFVIAPASSTAAAALDSDAMGHAVQITLSEPEGFLRGLAPLGLDGLFVGEVGAGLTLAQQVDLVRTASMAGTPLFALVSGGVTGPDLRVLRDSGVALVLAPAGSDLAALDTALRTVPPPRSARRAGGRELALVPSVGSGGHEEHDHEHEDDD